MRISIAPGSPGIRNERKDGGESGKNIQCYPSAIFLDDSSLAAHLYFIRLPGKGSGIAYQVGDAMSMRLMAMPTYKPVQLIAILGGRGYFFFATPCLRSRNNGAIRVPLA